MTEIEQDSIKVILVAPNKNINIARFPIKENKVIVKKGQVEPMFDAECVFNLKEISTTRIIGPFINRHRKREPCIIQQVGKPRAEKLKAPILKQKPKEKSNDNLGDPQDPEPQDLFEPITNEDRRDVVKREILKTLRKFQPISGTALIIIVLLLIINIVLQIIGFRFR